MNDKSVNLNRRDFIRSTALVGGGVLIGFNLFQACKPNSKPPVDLSTLDYTEFNAYISISKEGKVTIYAPNPEIGQGVKTSLPMLIAEELDVKWEDVYVVQASLDINKYKRQMAGGSRSVELAWIPLRETGAVARQMLVNAAAKKWNIDPSLCTTNEGVVSDQNGNTLSYGDLVLDAKDLEIPEEFSLKDPKDFKIIGTGKNNVEIDNIVRGVPLFGIDYEEDDMVYATVIHPPAFGLQLKSFDASEALKLEGVIDVVRFGEKVRKLFDTDFQYWWSFNMLDTDKVAIIATSTWTALKAKDLVQTEWFRSNEVLESSELHNELLDKALDAKPTRVLNEIGKVESTLAKSDRVLERTYACPFLPHNCMEPMNFFAHVQEDKIKLVGPCQTPEYTANVIEGMFGIEMANIEFNLTRMGGGFGRRLYGDFAFEAAEISSLIKRPVKLQYSRSDDMTGGIYRPAAKYKYKAAIKNNKLQGIHLKEAAINGNLFNKFSKGFPFGALENYKVDTVEVPSEITTGAWRAPSTNFQASAEQSFFDELAFELETDHVTLMLDLLGQVDPKNEDIYYNPNRFINVIQRVAENANWFGFKKKAFQGFSAYYSHRTHVAEIAEVILENNKPKVTKIYCVVDCGHVVNQNGAKAQTVGAILDGFGHMMYGELEFKDGKPIQNNFHNYNLLRMGNVPDVEVEFIDSQEAPTGLGEPTLPPVGGAIANALFRATGKRLYTQPYFKQL